MGVVAIDWVRGRFTVEMELLDDGLDVQSGLHKRALRSSNAGIVCECSPP